MPKKRPKPSERANQDKADPKQPKRSPSASSPTKPDKTPLRDPDPPFAHLTNPRQRAFLKAYCVTGHIVRSAEIAEVDRCMHYEWKKRDKTYRLAFKECERVLGDHLESEAWRRAVQGVERLKFDRHGMPLLDPRTQQPYIEREYSDTVLLTLLRATKPKKYRDKSETKHTVTFDKTPGPGDGLGAFIKKRVGDLNGSHN